MKKINWKIGTKIVSILVVASLIIALLQQTMAGHLTQSETKIYNGPKEIYRDIEGAKGRPSSPPGQDKKPPKDDGPQPDPSVNKWAVVIGISDYRGRFNDLQYCDDDATDMYNYLLSKGYPEGNIKLLLNGGAKAKAIIAALDWLNSWENATSEIVFFYSGHGSTYDGYDDDDDEYIDEAIISSDLYLILDGQLRQTFNGFDSEKISFIFDSCYSGGMDDLNNIQGRVITTACEELELSYETSGLQHGVFTYYFMEGLEASGVVEDAYGYAESKVVSYTSNLQHPLMFDGYSSDWAF